MHILVNNMQVFSDDNERVQRIVSQSITENDKIHAVGPYSIFKAMTAFSENHPDIKMSPLSF